MKKIRYTVIDHKTNIKNTYTKLSWDVAFLLIFLMGIGTGIIITNIL